MTKTIYEIRVGGWIGPAAREAFRDLAVDVVPPTTVLTAELEPAELHTVLDSVRDLGLELVEIRQHADSGGCNAEGGGGYQHGHLDTRWTPPPPKQPELPGS